MVLKSTALQRIVVVAAEAAPYSKTGGLGDVVGSLPISLADRGHHVMVVTPRYLTSTLQRQLMARLHDCQTWVKLKLSGIEHWVNFHHEERDGVNWVFVEHSSFEREGGLYGNSHGVYEDNSFRYASAHACAVLNSYLRTAPSAASYTKGLFSLHRSAIGNRRMQKQLKRRVAGQLPLQRPSSKLSDHLSHVWRTIYDE
jgi:hypothetical protein